MHYLSPACLDSHQLLHCLVMKCLDLELNQVLRGAHASEACSGLHLNGIEMKSIGSRTGAFMSQIVYLFTNPSSLPEKNLVIMECTLIPFLGSGWLAHERYCLCLSDTSRRCFSLEDILIFVLVSLYLTTWNDNDSSGTLLKP